MARNVENRAGDNGDRTASRAGTRRLTLTSRLVRSDGQPDRRTVYPPDLSDDARMATWLSADSDAFVDLRTSR